MLDTPQNSTISPIDFFRVKALEAATEKTRENLLRAVETLSAFAGDSDISFDSFNGAMLGEMVAHLLFRGYTPKTIANNVLKRLATLYNKAVDEGPAHPAGSFRELQNALVSDKTTVLLPTLDPDTFAGLQAIYRTDYQASPTLQLAKDILLFAIYMGGMSLDDIARYRKDSYTGEDENIISIISRYSRPRNKYLFPLDQIHSTPRQMQHRLLSLIQPLLSRHGLIIPADMPHPIFSLWSNAAMACGIPASDIAACLGTRSKEILLTAFAEPSALTSGEIERIRSTVSTTLTHNPLHWYAMHLRRNVAFADVTSRLSESGISLAETYYPMEEIVRRAGRKKIFERRPVISWLVFFRARRTDLDSLYRAIGDLAWGYRVSHTPASPYAIVSDTEVRSYQEAIGTLSPSTILLPNDAGELRSGDHVVILGGEMNGLQGRFITARGTASGATVYRIRLDGGGHASWIVDRDPRLVRKLPTPRPTALTRQAAT